ncbi:MAG: hypothetical protein ACJAX5_001545 [Patiriisocius sp.]|jgi:hypothetical protein
MQSSGRREFPCLEREQQNLFVDIKKTIYKNPNIHIVLVPRFVHEALEALCFDLNIGFFGNFLFNILSGANTYIGVTPRQGPEAVEFLPDQQNLIRLSGIRPRLLSISFEIFRMSW